MRNFWSLLTLAVNQIVTKNLKRKWWRHSLPYIWKKMACWNLFENMDTPLWWSWFLYFNNFFFYYCSSSFNHFAFEVLTRFLFFLKISCLKAFLTLDFIFMDMWHFLASNFTWDFSVSYYILQFLNSIWFLSYLKFSFFFFCKWRLKKKTVNVLDKPVYCLRS